MTSYSRVQLQPAYVLHQRPYRDTSAIVEIFSEEFGRRSLLVKGLKRPKSKLKGLLQPFQPLLISWVGKSELCTLTDAELYSPVVAMKPRYLPGAFYLNELLLKTLHKDDPHDDIFIVYHRTLEKFQQLSGEVNDELLWQAYLRWFELSLMQSTGYGMVLDHDVLSRQLIQPENQYEYLLDRGPVKMEQEKPLNDGVAVSGEVLLMLMDHSTMVQVARQNDDNSKRLFKEAKRLLRAVIDSQLGYRNLHSRDLFVHLPRNEPSTNSEVEDGVVTNNRLTEQEVG